MFTLQTKLVLGAMLLALIGGLIWHEVGVHKKAARVDEAEKALSDYTKAVDARDKQAKQMQADIEEARVATKAAIQTVTAAITDLRNHPPKASVIREQLPGEPCPSMRLDPGWVRDLNTASAAANSVPYPD